MKKPRLLDLFCGVGGMSWGYHLAGFEVVGVDKYTQPDYPLKFYQMDWKEALDRINLDKFDVIHASPPCQGYATVTPHPYRAFHPRLIKTVRDRLIATGKPYIIENVESAKKYMKNPVMLCGVMFPAECRVNRHRLFESNVDLHPAPAHPKCRGRIERGHAMTIAGHGSKIGDTDIWKVQQAMGIDWTTNRHSLVEAIPPIFAEWLGHRLRMRTLTK